MRLAIINTLKEITEFGNRVRQAFTAPEDYGTPYATVKMLEDSPSVNNKHGAFVGCQVFIYTAPDSFIDLDGLVIKVVSKLDKVTLATDESPARYFRPELSIIQADFFDDIRKLFMKRVDFTIPQFRV